MKTAARIAISAVAFALVAAGCSSSDEQSAPLTPDGLAAAVTTDAMVAHLDALDKIARENGGNRAAGTTGYDASVAYVTSKLKEKGFDVQTPEFDIHDFEVNGESLKAGDRDFKISALGYSPATPKDGVRGRLAVLPTGDKPGCDATDYDGIDVRGAIALVHRGDCTFAAKEKLAAEHGAVALLVVVAGDDIRVGTLGEDNSAKLPTAAISDKDVDALVGSGEATLAIDSKSTTLKSKNIIAQTKTGSADNVIMVGAHLDSVPEGPGINDNGTGSAAVLETALQLGSEPNVANAVRFAWWGGEELGLLGSTDYVDHLSPDQRLDIAMYLNFDMLGSPNPGYLTYDGDNSDKLGEPAGPDGSAAIERVFNSFLLREGVTPDGTDFDGRSDYGPFIEHKIPSGGVFSGAEEIKSAAEAAKWGGEADKPFDPNYHAPGDTLANVNREVFGRNGDAVAYSVATYALSIEGPNGVPSRADRASARGDDK
ncbi:M28 family metallopeptidase [Antrihabitans stalactiti]|uniref:M28 family peptidase n=1 Tax=Antrihabitans stalactiti TaxID=2584121 RepID=A0A848KGH1_9NOCA|nr:M28 family metallopeptidase [Antrihabitans stalactiti]NMN98103.1 M28 family peptidase [Antrihabitans stalactiti]